MRKMLDRREYDSVCHRVAQALEDCLAVEPDEITPSATLVSDLGSEEIDCLDLTFRLEKGFDLRIEPGTFHFPDLPEPRELNIPRTGVRVRTVQDLVDMILIQLVSKRLLSVEFRSMHFFVGNDGRLHAAVSLEDGSYAYADGSRRLPSGISLICWGNWASILRELEELINNPHSVEADLQTFLQRYPELIQGEEYDILIPQAVVCPIEAKIDFVAKPIDQRGFVKLLEIKTPRMRLIKRTHHLQNPFSYKLYEAVQQLRRYARAFQNSDVRARFRLAYGIDVYRPDLHLIAGRQYQLQLIERFIDFAREEQVKIETWDQALQRMRRKYT